MHQGPPGICPTRSRDLGDLRPSCRPLSATRQRCAWLVSFFGEDLIAQTDALLAAVQAGTVDSGLAIIPEPECPTGGNGLHTISAQVGPASAEPAAMSADLSGNCVIRLHPGSPGAGHPSGVAGTAERRGWVRNPVGAGFSGWSRLGESNPRPTHYEKPGIPPRARYLHR